MVRLVNGNLLPMVQQHQTEIEVVVSASLQRLRITRWKGLPRRRQGRMTTGRRCIMVYHGVSWCIMVYRHVCNRLYLHAIQESSGGTIFCFHCNLRRMFETRSGRIQIQRNDIKRCKTRQ